MENTGKVIVVAGIVLVAVGLLIWLFGNKFSWFGNLPGDIKVESRTCGIKFYAPIASMVVVSVLLTLMLWLLRKFFNH